MAVYLDYAAATPVDDDVLAAMEPYFNTNFFNPSAMYGPAIEANRALEQARTDIAAVIGAKSSEIIFTAGGTEANNLAIHGVMRHQNEASHIVISAIEHESILEPARLYEYDELPVSEQGIVGAGKLTELIRDNTVLVSIMYANNEVGTVQPIREIAQKIDEIRKNRQKGKNKLPLYLHVDAAQAGNYLDMHVHRLGVDLMTINGGKLYGPKQTGVLYVKTGVVIEPIIYGGGQERNIRSGTENVAGVVGLAAALKKSSQLRHVETTRLQNFQKLFISGLKDSFPDVVINGSLKQRLPNNVHITLIGSDNERLLMALDQEGIYAAAGSACSASNEEPSHVLKAMGISEADIQSSLRFSMGRQTSQNDIENTLKILQEIVR